LKLEKAYPQAEVLTMAFQEERSREENNLKILTSTSLLSLPVLAVFGANPKRGAELRSDDTGAFVVPSSA